MITTYTSGAYTVHTMATLTMTGYVRSAAVIGTVLTVLTEIPSLHQCYTAHTLGSMLATTTRQYVIYNHLAVCYSTTTWQNAMYNH